MVSFVEIITEKCVCPCLRDRLERFSNEFFKSDEKKCLDLSSNV